MSISTSDRSSVFSSEVDRVLAGGGADHLHAVPFEQAVEREDVADVVVHHQHFPALQRLVALVQGLDHLLLGRRQVRDHPMQEQRRLIEQALGRAHALQHDALGLAPQLLFFGS